MDLGASFSRPELIYYRPLSGHLYLGHIDSLGRYRSETLQTGPIQRILAAREKERTKYTLARLIGPSKIDEKTEEEAWKDRGRNPYFIKLNLKFLSLMGLIRL